MTDAEILDTLNDIFRDILDDEDIELTPETTAQDVADWDSANHINIIVSAEMRFGVKFSSGDVERMKNVGDFVALIRRKLADKG